MGLSGELVFFKDHWDNVILYELCGFVGVDGFSANTFDHPRARASAASSALAVVVGSFLIIAGLMASRSNGDHRMSRRFSWADLPLGRVAPLSFSIICLSIWPLAILEAHSWKSRGQVIITFLRWFISMNLQNWAVLFMILRAIVLSLCAMALGA